MVTVVHEVLIAFLAEIIDLSMAALLALAQTPVKVKNCLPIKPLEIEVANALSLKEIVKELGMFIGVEVLESLAVVRATNTTTAHLEVAPAWNQYMLELVGQFFKARDLCITHLQQ